MNTPKDIYAIMARLTAYWQTLPYLRLEQLLQVLASSEGLDDAFYMDNKALDKALSKRGF